MMGECIARLSKPKKQKRELQERTVFIRKSAQQDQWINMNEISGVITVH